jgi:hypothetical protein
MERFTPVENAPGTHWTVPITATYSLCRNLRAVFRHKHREDFVSLLVSRGYKL